MSDPVIDLQSARQGWLAAVDAPRGDEHLPHFSDLTGCPRDIFLRLRGDARLPMPRFIIGHAVEEYAAQQLAANLSAGMAVRRAREIEWTGIIGHIDLEIVDTETEKVLMVVDVSTTARKGDPQPNDGHTLKTAAYAAAVGAPDFCEWVFKLGFDGGRIDIIDDAMHFFRTEDFLVQVLERREMLHGVMAALKGEAPPPAEEPPEWAEWKCRAYCNAATCSKNGKLA